MYATYPASKLRVPIQVGSGEVAIYFLKRPASSFSSSSDSSSPLGNGEGSAIECWVDNNYAGAVVLENAASNIDEPVPALEVIDRFVSRGSHYVECMVLGEEGVAGPVFEVLGVFAT